MDIGVLWDRNIIRKESEKILKYQSLCSELKQMWGQDVVLISVMICATRYFTKVLKIPGKLQTLDPECKKGNCVFVPKTMLPRHMVPEGKLL